MVSERWVIIAILASADVPAGFRLADYADCLAALIEALGLGPAHVAGSSWGGTVAQELYRHNPALVVTQDWSGLDAILDRLMDLLRTCGVPDPAQR